MRNTDMIRAAADWADERGLSPTDVRADWGGATVSFHTYATVNDSREGLVLLALVAGVSEVRTASPGLWVEGRVGPGLRAVVYAGTWTPDDDGELAEVAAGLRSVLGRGVAA